MIKTSPGHPNPLGAHLVTGGINFSLFCQRVEEVTLVIETAEKQLQFQLDPKTNRTKAVWHILIRGLSPPFLYCYKLGKSQKSLIDPYANVLSSPSIWSNREERYAPKGIFLEPSSFDWEKITSPNYQTNELIIYEMHVRGLTRHKTSEVKHPGTFLGVIEKIPYLKELGINAVELMPIQEFNECEYSKISKETGKQLCNYFGYATVNYFSLMNRYATSYKQSIHEFKMLVKELHRNKIEVILDIVFNHTAEKGGEDVYSFMGIDCSVYYLLKEGNHTNYSGCGHTMNLNHPCVRKFVKEVLRYWVVEMHVDGFRFDLASIMNRDQSGELLKNSPLVEELSLDPTLSQTKLIAEPWDLGAYQLGEFESEKNRWSEWNGKYRDAVRKFLRGDPFSKNEFADRICGSQDIFRKRAPSASINFITSHDGFTLRDLVSYDHKRNFSNGEENRDGARENFSWNMGKEGETDDRFIRDFRNRQMKNFIVALFISRGVPMLLMGDEYGHTKRGNNNSWCQDNELNWFLWDQKNPLYFFVKQMISFRKEHTVFQKDCFYREEEISWHGPNGADINWDDRDPFLALTIKVNDKKSLYIAFNATKEPTYFLLPEDHTKKKWNLIVDTSHLPPDDFLTSRAIDEKDLRLAPYSSVILASTLR